MDVAVVGDRYFVIGFELAGAVAYVVKSGKEAAQVMRKIVDEKKHKLVILPEELAEATREERVRVIKRGEVYPIFVVIPGLRGAAGKRVEELRELISQAVGAQIKI